MSYRRDAFFLIWTVKGVILFTKIKLPGGRKYLEKKALGFIFDQFKLHSGKAKKAIEYVQLKRGI